MTDHTKSKLLVALLGITLLCALVNTVARISPAAVECHLQARRR